MYSGEFVKLWQKISKEMKSYMERELAPSLTESQLHVLEILIEQEPMKPSELLRYLETTPAAVTTLLDRMEKNNLIERKRDLEDRRVVWIHVSAYGVEQCERGRKVRETFLANSLDKLSQRNQQLLVFLLGRITTDTETTTMAKTS